MMSDPLSSLRKSRKTPFNSHGAIGGSQRKNIPFRNADYTTDENKLLEEISGNMAASKLKELSQTAGASTKSRSQKIPHSTESLPRSTPSDPELLSLMMTRVTQLEQKLQYQTKEVKERDKKIRILEDKIKILQNARETGEGGRVLELEKQCLLLQQQAHEMETFLADYGMVWVGMSDDPKSGVYNDEDLELSGDEDEEESELWMRNESVAGPGDPSFEIDHDLVIKNINELNELAGEGESLIQHTVDGARLRRKDNIPLCLYANGMMLFAGPFRPFTDPSTQACIRDIMDGYFPSELQKRFPDGVPFQVKDKRQVHFHDRLSKLFEGEGQVVGGDSGPSRLVGNERYTDVEESSELPGPRLSMEQFLRKIPQSVIKGGKVIDVRQGIAEQLKGSSPGGVTVVETSSVEEIRDRLKVHADHRPASSKDLATLRIKSETGDHTYILKMRFTETIGDLRKYLDKERPRGAKQYELMTTFPNQTYTDISLTLQQCQLVPNATLHLRSI